MVKLQDHQCRLDQSEEGSQLPELSSSYNPTLPPGPRRLRILNLMDRLFHARTFLDQMRHKYGAMAFYRLPHADCCMVFDPTLIQEVYIDRRTEFPKLLHMGTQSSLIRNPGLARSNDDEHTRKRQFHKRVFSRELAPIHGEVIIKNISDIQINWHPDQVIDAKAEATAFVTGAMTDACFGPDMQVNRRLIQRALFGVKWDRILDYLPFTPLLRKLPLPPNYSAKRSFRKLRGIHNDLITKARSQPAPRTDWVSQILYSYEDECGFPIWDLAEVRDEAWDLLLGNIDPMVESITWCLAYVSQFPTVQDKLEQEADDLLVGGRALAVDDYHKLPYARAVYLEAIRLAPPVYFIERKARDNTTLGGFRIPKGTNLHLAIGALHQFSEKWHNPHNFLPERWLSQLDDGLPGNSCYRPFGFEPRDCSGWGFSMMGAVFLLASIAQRFRLTPVNMRLDKPDFKLQYGIKGPVNMKVKKRSDRA